MTTRRVLDEEFDLQTIIGIPVQNLSPDLEWETAYPVVNRITLLVEGIVDANYPQEYNGGHWKTGALVDGKIVVGEFYCDFAVAQLDES